MAKNKEFLLLEQCWKKFNNFTWWSNPSLDSETETKIQEALKILTENKTTIVIAHRLSTILNSNNIYLIDAGKVIANGNMKNYYLNLTFIKIFMINKLKGNDFFIYQIFLSIILIFSPIIIIHRIIKNKEDKFRVKEKFCFFSKKRNTGKLIWFHG